MTKAIVFDMGGVLVDLDIHRCIKEFKERAGFESIEEILDSCHQKGVICELEAGKITVDEFYARALEQCRPGATADDVRESFCSLLQGVPQYKADLLNSLKADYDLYILSNNNPITIDYTASQFAEVGAPYEETFKDMFISSSLKMLKPSREIYLEVIRRIGVEPGEILFIDDSQRNVDAASALGIRAVYYNPKTDDLRDTVLGALKA